MQKLIERAFWVSAATAAICLLAFMVREGFAQRGGA